MKTPKRTLSDALAAASEVDHVRLSDIELGFVCTRSGAFAASRAIGNDWADRFPAIVEAAARL
jgi:hypothetical protein